MIQVDVEVTISSSSSFNQYKTSLVCVPADAELCGGGKHHRALSHSSVLHNSWLICDARLYIGRHCDTALKMSLGVVERDAGLRADADTRKRSLSRRNGH